MTSALLPIRADLAGGGVTRQVYDPTVEAGTNLVSWHRSDYGITSSGTPARISAWAPKSGSDTFAQATGANQPYLVTHGPSDVALLGFRGVAEYMSAGPIPATGAGARTVVVVANKVQLPGTGTAYYHLLHYGTASSNQAYGITVRNNCWANHYWSAVFQTTKQSGDYGVSIVLTRYSGTVEEIVVNGVSAGTNTVTLNTGSGAMLLGSRINPYFEPNICDIAEVITWSRRLTDAELATLFTKLGSYYGLTL